MLYRLYIIYRKLSRYIYNNLYDVLRCTSPPLVLSKRFFEYVCKLTRMPTRPLIPPYRSFYTFARARLCVCVCLHVRRRAPLLGRSPRLGSGGAFGHPCKAPDDRPTCPIQGPARGVRFGPAPIGQVLADEEITQGLSLGPGKSLTAPAPARRAKIPGQERGRCP